jgi:capsular exopolysaccharide synthesis family protein
MSRIYEALERAESEREGTSALEQEQVKRTTGTSPVEDPPVAENSRLFDTIACHPWKPSKSFLPTLADTGVAIEQFRSLRSSIYQIRDQIPLKTVVISSGMTAEGKTFVAANLAISLARNNERPVLLIDADLRRPAIHKLLGIGETPGLMQYLAGEAEPAEILQRDAGGEITDARGAHAISNIGFIPAGYGSDHAPELVGNHRIEELIAWVSPHFSWIIIDSPPVLAVTDAVDLARAADGVLLVARGATTKFDIAQRAQAAFSNSRVLGFVLNAVKNAPRSGSYYYYYRGERADETPKTSRINPVLKGRGFSRAVKRG